MPVRRAFLASLVAAGVGGATSGARAQPALTTLRFGAAPVDVITPLLYAQDAGIYRKFGLDVQFVKINNGPAIASAVAGGAVELAHAATITVIQAHAKGIPFTLIGDLATYRAERPDDALMVATDSPIKTPKDLEGKTLGTVSLGGMPTLGTYAWLDAHGIDRSTIKWIELPAAASLVALEQRRVDAAVLYEPFFSAFLSSGKARVLGFPYDAIASRFSNASLFTTTSWAGAHPDLVERFLQASEEASRYVGEHESETVPLIATFAGIDLKTAANIHHEGRGIVLAPEDIQPLIDAAVRYKFIPTGFRAQELICSCALRR